MHGEKKEKKDELKALRWLAVGILLLLILAFTTSSVQYGNGTNKLQILEKKIYTSSEVKNK